MQERIHFFKMGGRGRGSRGVALRQRRSGFKLDLDSPGDTPHRISPVGLTPGPASARRSDAALIRQAENGGALPE